MAALYLLNLYYRNDSWITKYDNISKIDYSMGSSIFTVKAPTADLLWYGNNPTICESPYIVTYQDDEYQHIEEIQCKEAQALANYWNQQPELNDPAFQAQLKEAQERNERVMGFWELAKFRLHKKIPNTLTFEERKALLIKSKEWNCWIHQNNKHLSEAELTEDNIQREIDSAGTHWGMELMKNFQKFEWFSIALNKEICKIYIP